MQRLPASQLAAEMLLSAAERGGLVMMAAWQAGAARRCYTFRAFSRARNRFLAEEL